MSSSSRRASIYQRILREDGHDGRAVSNDETNTSSTRTSSSSSASTSSSSSSSSLSSFGFFEANRHTSAFNSTVSGGTDSRDVAVNRENAPAPHPHLLDDNARMSTFPFASRPPARTSSVWQLTTPPTPPPRLELTTTLHAPPHPPLSSTPIRPSSDGAAARISLVAAERLMSDGGTSAVWRTTTTTGAVARTPYAALPNDTCPVTRELERSFLNDTGRFKVYTGHTPHTKTVIYSRSLQTYYTWHGDEHNNNNRPVRHTVPSLTSTDLEPFNEVGHTLAVDNSRSYVRLCAFDLDCVCRRNFGTPHVNETLANAVRDKLVEMLCQLTARERILCVVWRKDCGFHLYTDVSISMPLHLELGLRLSAEFRNSGVHVEVPTHMPLPYSAKRSGEPYRPLLVGQPGVPLLGTAPYCDRYEFKRHTALVGSGTLVAELDTRRGPLYMTGEQSTVQKCDTPTLSFVTAIQFRPTGGHLRPLQEYIAHVNESTAAAAADTTRPAATSVGPGDAGNNIVYDLLTTEAFATFVDTFNATHYDVAPATTTTAGRIPDYGRFIQVSAVDKGGLYLQHYVAALHKIMRPVEDEDFRRLLYFVYRLVLDNDPTVGRLIAKYDGNTLNCYNDSYDAMLRWLSYVLIYDLSVEAPLETHINRIMCDTLNVPSLDAWSAEYKPLRGSAKEKKKCLALNAYTDAMLRMKYLVRHNNVWYVYTNEGYHMNAQIGSLPCINQWVNLDDSAKRHVENQSSQFNEQKMWSTHDFMFATSVGVFNSITGLYTAKSPLLRFNKSRDCAIWEPERPFIMYEDQNRDILTLSETAKRFADTVYDRVTDLFLHFQIIPAMIQMPQVYNIDDLKLGRFFELFESHENIGAAHFLVDLYPIDPKFVYLVMLLYTRYGIDTLMDYNKLVDSVFKYKTNVTDTDWAEEFRPKLDRVTFSGGGDRDDSSGHMARLMSLCGEDLDGDITEDFCLYGVMIAVCMSKCFSFRPLLRAFGVHELPACADRTRIPEQYRDVDYGTSLDGYRLILDQTLKTVYGGELTVFEKALARMTIQVGMSTCFDPDTTRELINMVSAVFVPRNILKKMFILTGPQSTGKSYFCDLLVKICSPNVGRFQDIRHAVERANVTTKTNVTIINEASVMNPHHMKSVTGNDGESAQVFYSQNYQMQEFQSLIYGATNNVILFRDSEKKMYNIDRTTIDRIHAISLNGQQVFESEEKNRNDSLFMMVATSRFFSGIMNGPQETSASALGWLAYITYYHRRDKNYKPLLNTTNPDVLAYQQRVYYQNNSLYAFLVQSGITEEPGFYMDQQSLVLTVRRSIEDKVHARTVPTFSDFITQFNAHYNVKLEHLKTVPDLQYTALVDHIKTTMETVKCPGRHVTEVELETRLKVYSTRTNQTNAREYFKRKHPQFDHRQRVFTDVRFVHDTTDSYAGNEIDTIGASNNGGSAASRDNGHGSGVSGSNSNGANNNLLYPTTFVTDSV